MAFLDDIAMLKKRQEALEEDQRKMWMTVRALQPPAVVVHDSSFQVSSDDPSRSPKVSFKFSHEALLEFNRQCDRRHRGPIDDSLVTWLEKYIGEQLTKFASNYNQNAT